MNFPGADRSNGGETIATMPGEVFIPGVVGSSPPPGPESGSGTGDGAETGSLPGDQDDDSGSGLPDPNGRNGFF